VSTDNELETHATGSTTESLRQSNEKMSKIDCFSCDFHSFTGSNILLWRRGSSVVTASNLMITRDPRFRLLDEYSLQIKGVRPQDAGDYICQIGDQENRDLVHTVEILVPPTVRAHPDTGHVTARKGSTVTLECKASGNPVPSISWVKRVTKLIAYAYQSVISSDFYFHRSLLTTHRNWPRVHR